MVDGEDIFVFLRNFEECSGHYDCEDFIVTVNANVLFVPHCNPTLSVVHCCCCCYVISVFFVRF